MPYEDKHDFEIDPALDTPFEHMRGTVESVLRLIDRGNFERAQMLLLVTIAEALISLAETMKDRP